MFTDQTELMNVIWITLLVVVWGIGFFTGKTP